MQRARAGVPHVILMAAVLALATACAPGAPPAPDGTEQPADPGSGQDSQDSQDSGDVVAIPGGFDFDRVRLMDPADLPDGIPVPVPFGGTIDDSVSISDGQSLIVDYDPRFFATAAAFYQTWIDREQLDSSPLVNFSEDSVGWRIDIEGAAVDVRLDVDSERSTTRLIILWP